MMFLLNARFFFSLFYRYLFFRDIVLFVPSVFAAVLPVQLTGDQNIIIIYLDLAISLNNFTLKFSRNIFPKSFLKRRSCLFLYFIETGVLLKYSPIKIYFFDRNTVSNSLISY